MKNFFCQIKQNISKNQSEQEKKQERFEKVSKEWGVKKDFFMKGNR